MQKYRFQILLAAAVAAAAPNMALGAACLENSSPGRICTANDFETVSEELISGPSSCVDGEIIPGDLVMRIGLLGNRNSTYDIGFFIGDADNSPINGESCTFDSLDRIEPVDGIFDGLSGNGPYRNLEGNACGDANKSDRVIYKDITLSNVLCQDLNNDGTLDVAYAITWKQNSSACDDASDPANFSLSTSSKCIDTIGDIGEVPVVPPNPEIPVIRVQKTAEPLVISPGEDVDYTINVVNEGPITVFIDTLVDDKFGDLNGAGSCNMPQEIASGEIYTCSFNAFPSGTAPGVHLNTVTASGTGDGKPVSDMGRALVNFTEVAKGAIGYLVWNDLNADGIKQENEEGIAGVTIELYEERIPTPTIAVTNESGFYAFTDLGGGIYNVVAVEDSSGPLDNLVRTTADNPLEVVLKPGQVNTFANFGYVRAEMTVSKAVSPQVVFAPGGLVTYTVEVQNSGVIAWELTELVDDKFGDLIDQGDCALPATPLAPGDIYSCEFDRQIDGNPGENHTNTVQAAAKDLVEGYFIYGADDAVVGIEDPVNGSLGNLVWLDENANGVLDEGEVGLNQVTIDLSYDADSDGNYETPVATDTTINNGEYGFIGLPAGNYRVTVTDTNQILKDRFLTTPPEPLDLILAPGEYYDSADFGYADIPKPAIQVIKIPSEFIVKSPSAEVTYSIIVLNIGDTAVTLDQLIDSRFGDLNGLGTCELGVSITKRQTYKCRFTETISGEPLEIHRNTVSARATDANNNITFDSGPAAVLFLAPSSAAIGDQVWEDLNADGVFDAGEPGIKNVTVDLYQAGTRLATTSTDASGKYDFTALAAGNYQVVVSDTTGALDGFILTGGAEPLDVNLETGEIFNDADFGYAAAAIEVVKIGNRRALLGSSGEVIYTITTRNSSYVNVTLTGLDDDRFGDLNGQGNCALPVAISARSSVACQFTQIITGSPGSVHTNIVTATAVDDENNVVDSKSSFSVDFVPINFGASGYLVWDDENGNGQRESSEPGIGNVTVELQLDEDNNGRYEKRTATAVTNSNGYYVFVPVPTGNWRIEVTDEYAVLTDKMLTGGTNPNAFSLTSGQIYQNANFGYFVDPTEPPIDPPPIDPPDTEIQNIPVTPQWILGLIILGALGLGLNARRRIERR